MVANDSPKGEADLQSLQERVRQLEALVETSLLVNSTLDLRELASSIIHSATALIGAERGSLFLVDSGAGTLRSLVAQGLGDDQELTLKVGDGIVGSVAATGDAIILNSPYDDPRFDPSVDRATGFVTRSLLTVPVRDRDGVLTAVLQLLNHGDSGFSDRDVAFLAELGVAFAIALTTARMHQEIVARERMQEELRLAAEIQRTLQPRDDSMPEGLELATLMQPCHEVGGDYFDLIPGGDGKRWWLVVADISGKGVSAGMIAANVQAYMWSRRQDAAPLAQVVAEGNDLLYGLAQGRKFATMAVAEWEPERASLRWVSAGHPPIFLCRSGRMSALEATGRPIGLLPRQSYEQGEVALAVDDYFLIYTDGVIEAGMGTDRGEFGIDIVGELAAGGGAAVEVVARLSAGLEKHLDGAPLDDDLTVLCARYTG